MCSFIAACTALTELVINDTNGQQIVQVYEKAAKLHVVCLITSGHCTEQWWYYASE